MNFNKKIILAVVLLGSIGCQTYLPAKAEDQPNDVKNRREIAEKQAIESILTAYPDKKTKVKVAEPIQQKSSFIFKLELDNGSELLIDANTDKVLATEP